MNQSLFDDARMKLPEAMQLTIESLKAYGSKYGHWAMAFSGGKDSTALITIVVYLIEQGLIPEPKSLTVFYADTRMELPPLWISAMQILSELRERGIKTQVVLPELDKRYFVYMLGRGVPPPNNKTLRWCTGQIKIAPMISALRNLHESVDEKFLMLTGVRLGESAVRDQRIAMSCSRDGGECGQGWFQQSTPESVADTLAPLLHWRVCHIWAWLATQAPAEGFSTRNVALVYGGDEAEELNARTGCIGCPLATKDTALDYILKQEEWSYLAPLKKLRPLYRHLRKARNRHRQPGTETRKDGTRSANPQRLGPLTLEVREYALNEILSIQREINLAARSLNRPKIDLINLEEQSRIRELIALKTFPNKWNGDEPDGLVMLDKYWKDGNIQPLLMEFE
jgi:DNA sulfur modification protein DndC